MSVCELSSRHFWYGTLESRKSDPAGASVGYCHAFCDYWLPLLRTFHTCVWWVGWCSWGKNHVDSCLQARLILKYGCGGVVGVAGVGAGDSKVTLTCTFTHHWRCAFAHPWIWCEDGAGCGVNMLTHACTLTGATPSNVLLDSTCIIDARLDKAPTHQLYQYELVILQEKKTSEKPSAM